MKKTILIICSVFLFMSCKGQEKKQDGVSTTQVKEKALIQRKSILTAQEKEQIMNETYDSLMNTDTTYPRLTTKNYVEM